MRTCVLTPFSPPHTRVRTMINMIGASLQIIDNDNVCIILFSVQLGLIRSQEKEIEMLKTKIAQDLAVMPQDTFGPTPTCATSKLRLNSEVRVTGTKIRSNESPCPGCTVSNLDPNATAYTPKSSLVASTEA